MNNISITKKSGETEAFDAEKLKQSLIRSGASQTDAEYVTGIICKNIVDGMSTHKVYSQAYNLLRKQSNKVAGRYRLKKAIFDMGPTGYPFEILVGELIKLKGFVTQTGLILDGNCIQHEVDVFATKSDKTVFVECKFHNDVRRKSDVKVALYVNSRFHDLKKKHEQEKDNDHKFEGWIVTNTRFSKDAIEYGECAGIKMISWDFPANNNLRQLVDSSGIHPITTMKNITKKEKSYLMEKEIVLCRQLTEQRNLLKQMGIKDNRIKRIIDEAYQISETT